jgi:hypothetical protein
LLYAGRYLTRVNHQSNGIMAGRPEAAQTRGVSQPRASNRSTRAAPDREVPRVIKAGDWRFPRIAWDVSRPRYYRRGDGRNREAGC